MNATQLNLPMSFSIVNDNHDERTKQANQRQAHVCSRCFSDYDIIRVKRNLFFKALFPNIYRYQCTCCGNTYHKRQTKMVGIKTKKNTNNQFTLG